MVHAVHTEVPGVLVIEPDLHRDHRGVFYESLRIDRLAELTGRPFHPQQVNLSVSRRNTLRGLHSVTVPPGQAKFVSCVRGALLDFTVDLRVGSPTFGRHTSTVLDAASGRSVFVPEGVGHGFLALADDTCTSYVLSSPYVPGTQVHIDPLDADLALPWGFDDPPLMSHADAQAVSVRQALADGLLAAWEA